MNILETDQAERHQIGCDLGLTTEEITQIEQAVQAKSRWSVAPFDAAWKFDWTVVLGALERGRDVASILEQMERDRRAMEQWRLGETFTWWQCARREVQETTKETSI